LITEYEHQVRVRYQETDGQARVHHANYANYFELARTEMLRTAGFSYKKMEESGLLLVVAEIEIKYFLPANFDDLLQIQIKTTKAKGARIEHHYEIICEGNKLAQGRTLLACINQAGKPQPIPQHLRIG
jgi:acyl-CoA thioester hydrolase